MKKYHIEIDTEALSDIHDITNWYDSQEVGLGKIFKDSVIKQIDDLTINPLIFAIRYKEIRCRLVKRFPYMIHFHINQKNYTIVILAVISTGRNPKIWEEKTNRV